MLEELIRAYDPSLPIEKAVTPPSAWYTDAVFANHENSAVFGRGWIVVGRVEQLEKEGDYITATMANEPLVIVKTADGIRGYYNVCRHHAALVMEGESGCARAMQCPYHGWTYGLDGRLLSTPQFGEAEDFDKEAHGLIPIRVATWEKWIFACLDEDAESLEAFLGSLADQLIPFRLDQLTFHKRVTYELDCNWKVFVDNYLDGGYHVPILHKALNSALDYSGYTITTKDRYCLQDCPTSRGDDDISSVRSGDRAHYYWQYPNFMINLYEGVMDTNLVLPLGADRCVIYFDYYFGENSAYTEDFKNRSIEVAHEVQLEDEAVCLAVQRGLQSKAFDTGPLSPAKEAGAHLFHRLLHADLSLSRK